MTDQRILLTVSGVIPADLDEQVESGARPRADYRVLADRLDADVVDVDAALAATGRLGAVLHRLAGRGALLAWYVLRVRSRYDVVVTDGEQVGLPYALLTRVVGRGATRHVMIVHVMSTRSKRAVMRLARLARRIDRYLVYATSQAGVLTGELGVPADRVVVTPFMVDTRFFDPAEIPPAAARAPRPVICSAGLERRDYETLLSAVGGLEADVVIAAASPWSTQPDTTRTATLPPNVRVERHDLYQLRTLYARADLLVMPLLDVDFQAGITTILEGMSMGLPIVCSRTVGQTDTIVDGEHGVYVPVGDALALRHAIDELLADPGRRARLGAAGRAWAVAHADVDRYADGFARVVAGVTGG